MTRQSADYPFDHPKDTADTAKDRLREMANKATDQLKSAAEGAQEIADKMTGQAREQGEKALEAAKNFKPFVEKSLKEQPMATLASAAIIGFMLGALWKK